MSNILLKLKGGDRRSIGKVSEVVRAVHKNPDLFKDLVSGLFDPDAIVRMRAADAMEKISSDNPEYLKPFKDKLIRLAGETRQQELRWHLAQMMPRLRLTSKETSALADIFFDYLKDSSKIVVTFAMQALSDLAMNNADLCDRVVGAIEKLTQTGSPAIKSRGKKLRMQLTKSKKAAR